MIVLRDGDSLRFGVTLRMAAATELFSHRYYDMYNTQSLPIPTSVEEIRERLSSRLHLRTELVAEFVSLGLTSVEAGRTADMFIREAREDKLK